MKAEDLGVTDQKKKEWVDSYLAIHKGEDTYVNAKKIINDIEKCKDELIDNIANTDANIYWNINESFQNLIKNIIDKYGIHK